MLVPVLALTMMQQVPEHWKGFTSRSGWTMNYPAEWRIASCRSCSDPKANGVFVDFFPSSEQEAGGWVMVSVLSCKPANVSVDSWLAEVAANANQNSHVSERRLTLGGNPALTVRYRTPRGVFMEAVYTVSGSHTYSIEFSGDESSKPPEELSNYPMYLDTAKSF